MLRKRKLVCFVIMICIILSSIAGCSNSNKNDEMKYQGEDQEMSKISQEASSEEGVSRNAFESPDGSIFENEEIEKKLREAVDSEETIVWIVEGGHMSSKIPGERLMEINRLLEKKGCSYKLALCYLDDRHVGDYAEAVEKLLEKGYGDICYLGSSEKGGKSYPQNVLVRRGYFTQLDDYLNSAAGKKLNDAINRQEWESVKFDGKISVIPNQNILSNRVFVAFSKKYFSRDIRDNFDGDLSHLADYITPEMKKDLGEFSLIWNMPYTYALNSMGYWVASDIWGDHMTGEMFAPFSVDKFYDLEKMLWSCRKAGTISDEMDIAEFFTEQGAAKLTEGRYAIAAFCGSNYLEKAKKDSYVVELPYYFAGGNGNNTGIVEKSEKKDGALEIISILYTDSEIANLLLFGKQGKDYEVKNGCAYDSDGGEYIEAFGCRSVFGIDDIAYTSNTGEFTPDVREEKKKYFASPHCKTSIFIGFQPDSNKWNYVLDQSDIDFVNVWREDDFEKEYKKLKSKFIKETEMIKDQMEKQFQEWHRKNG